MKDRLTKKMSNNDNNYPKLEYYSLNTDMNRFFNKDNSFKST